MRMSSSHWRSQWMQGMFALRHLSEMLVKRQLGGFHLVGPLGCSEKSGKARFWAGRWFLLEEAPAGCPVIGTAEDTLPCLLARQTQCKMWFRCWRNSTWRKRGVPWRSSGSCTRGSWSSSASSCPQSGSPRAAAPTAWPTAARQLSRRWPSGQKRGKNGTLGTQSQSSRAWGLWGRHVEGGST